MARFCFKDTLPPFDDATEFTLPRTHKVGRDILMSIPAELRALIYDFLCESEQEDQREYFGYLSSDESSSESSDDVLPDEDKTAYQAPSDTSCSEDNSPSEVSSTELHFGKGHTSERTSGDGISSNAETSDADLFPQSVGSNIVDDQPWTDVSNPSHSYVPVLPLKAVRPPTAIGVCRQMRNECLAHFFGNTIFRVDAGFDYVASTNSSWVEDNGDGPYELENVGASQHLFDPTARAWLDSLSQQDRALIQFRRLIFNPVNRYSESLGYNLHVHCKKQAFYIDMVISDGWMTVESMVQEGGLSALLAPRQIIAALSGLTNSQNDNGLSLAMVEELESKFGRETAEKQDCVPLKPSNWAEAAMLLPKDIVKNMQTSFHCLAEIVLLHGRTKAGDGAPDDDAEDGGIYEPVGHETIKSDQGMERDEEDDFDESAKNATILEEN